MGHLFSRAFKRITQGSQPTASTQQIHNQSSLDQQDTTNGYGSTSDRVQSIPVGQSIDSAEYAGLQGNASSTKAIATNSPQQELEEELEPKRSAEEAAIKIQALVRGHLTRKALKDAHSHTSPAPLNSLGQRQFDEECLLGNNNTATNSPIFLNLGRTPLTATSEDTNGRDNRLPTGREGAHQGGFKSNSSSATLDSVAEHSEQGQPPQLAEAQLSEHKPFEGSSDAGGEKKKPPLKLCTRASTYPPQLLETQPSEARDHSLSPVPSEANVSIDLNYDTPASASIDIGDHNIRPVDKLASVLYHNSVQGASVVVEGQANKLSEVQEEQATVVDQSTAAISLTTTSALGAQIELLGNGNTENSCSNYNSTNHKEAAAIRIQSAFRGYRTRKNSPYRTRSPPSNSPNKLQGEQLLNGTSAPSHHAMENRLEPIDEPVFFNTGADISRESVSNLGERRSSRPRARDSLDGLQSTNGAASTAEQHAMDGAAEEEQISVVTIDDNADRPRKGDCLQSKHDHCHRDSADLVGEEHKKDPMMRVETFDGITSNNQELTNELTDANESEFGTETVAALLGMTTIESIGANEKRPSVRSDASIETIGSSFAAALVSVDDEAVFSLANNPSELIEEAVDEDKSLGDGGVGGSDGYGVSLTVDQLDLEGLRLETSAAIEALIDRGGALVEDSMVSTDDQPVDHRREEEGEFVQASDDEEFDTKTLDKELKRVPTLDEQEQLIIELESDDIERRDPRGQTTTERTKSPSLPEETLEYGVLVADEEKQEEDATCVLGPPVTASSSQLETALEQHQQAPQSTAAGESTTSLDSSPVSGAERLEVNQTDSSGSSGDDEAEEERQGHLNEDTTSTNTQRPQKQQQPPTSGETTTPTSKNKKRHRNKRKSGKK